MTTSVSANASATKPPVKANATSKNAPAKAPVKSVKVSKPAVAAKPAAKSPAKTMPAKAPAQSAKPSKPAKPAVVKKPKLVRDSFTMPQVDHDLIKLCKKTAVASGRETKKSEVVRAAIQNFAALSTAQQLAAYAKLQAIALGRPKAK